MASCQYTDINTVGINERDILLFLENQNIRLSPFPRIVRNQATVSVVLRPFLDRLYRAHQIL